MRFTGKEQNNCSPLFSNIILLRHTTQCGVSLFAWPKSHYPKEGPWELPDGWVWLKLGDIGTWQSGATPRRGIKAYYGGTIPWLKTGDLNNGYITAIPEFITEKALNETSVKLNPSGSVLIAMYGATIGKIGILTFPATTNQACRACIDYQPVIQKYLFISFFRKKMPSFVRLEVEHSPIYRKR